MRLKWNCFIILLCCVALLSTLTCGAAQMPNDFLTVLKEDGTVAICGLTAAGAEKSCLTIPPYLDGTVVSELSAGALVGDGLYNWNLKELSIPPTVEVIDSAVFFPCKNLEKISASPWNPMFCSDNNVLFSKDMTTLLACPAGKNAQLYIVPNEVRDIGDHGFQGCINIRNIRLSPRLKKIGEAAFRGTKLKHIMIPPGVEFIGESAFDLCHSLEKIQVDKENKVYFSLDGVLFSSDASCLLRYPSGKCDTEYTVPQCIDCLDSHAFADNCNLSTIYLPATLKEIGAQALCAIEHLEEIQYAGSPAQWGQALDEPEHLPENISVLFDCLLKNEENYFRFTRNTSGSWSIIGLTENGKLFSTLSIPAEINGIPVTGISASFLDDAHRLTKLIIPSTVRNLKYLDFSKLPKLKQIHIAEGNPYYCSINGVVYSANLDTLLLYPPGKEDEYFVIPDSVCTIASNAFCGNPYLTSVIIPESVTTIGLRAFQNCTNLSHVPLPDSLEVLGTEAFFGCTSLEELTIPAKATQLGTEAFGSCTGLSKIQVAGDNTGYYCEDGVIYSADGTTLCYYSPSRTQKQFTIPDHVRTIGAGAFRGNRYLEEVTIPESVTKIEQFAFYGCSSLRELTIPARISQIEQGAFGNCAALSAIQVAAGNPDYYSESGVLYSKNHAMLVQYPSGKGSTICKIPGNVRKIANWAFAGCTRLTSVRMTDKVYTLGEHAFDGCTGLYYVGISKKISTLPRGLFAGCTNLHTVLLPATVTSIEESAFDRNLGLNINTVYFTGSTCQWHNLDVAKNNDGIRTGHIEHNLTASADMPLPYIIYSNRRVSVR